MSDALRRVAPILAESLAEDEAGAPAAWRNLRPPVDGRQSDAATRIARGVRRFFRAAGVSTVAEMSLPSGRRADLVGLSADGTISIVEIKSSVADWRADQKWRDYRAHCDRLYFAIDGQTPTELMPGDAGLLLADAFGAELLRAAPEHRLAPATRRTMLLRVARLAADRFHMLCDPDAGLSIRGR